MVEIFAKYSLELRLYFFNRLSTVDRREQIIDVLVDELFINVVNLLNQDAAPKGLPLRDFVFQCANESIQNFTGYKRDRIRLKAKISTEHSKRNHRKRK